MLILNVAEKPSVAKAISNILSKNVQTKKGMYKYCPNHTFDLNNDTMIFTSVLGHLYESDFDVKYKNWTGCDEYELFDADIIKTIRGDLIGIKNNIQKLSKNIKMAVIWTDCDREGENIGQQIESLIDKRIVVKRARFSGISRHEIMQAYENLQDINMKESDAVDARIELDLRCGSVFTRLQTLNLRNTEREGNEDNSVKTGVISYGQCQIPTLNFVVERQKQIDNFVPENFYSLSLKHNKNVFTWKRGNIFDKNAVVHFYNMLCEVSCIVSKVTCKEVSKIKPFPLRTVELQKVCATYYKMAGNEIMDIAEKLYNRGYISYPRTETDSFANNFGFERILNKLKEDTEYTNYLDNFAFKHPRCGKNNDQAHYPIYPLKSGNDLSGKERNVYDFVARRFIACCSENAKGDETVIGLKMCAPVKRSFGVEEYFELRGLKIKERNYLDIYKYDTWGTKEIFKWKEYVEGKTLERKKGELSVKDSKTTVPQDLMEKDLIVLMDKNGIGTDATIHEHINKIQVRKYAYKIGQYIKPTDLGMNLINAYRELELPIHECQIRKAMEENLVKVCRGEMSKNELVQREIKIYKEIYQKFKSQIKKYTEIMKIQNEFKNRKKTVRKGDGENKPKRQKTESIKENVEVNEVILCHCKREASKKQCSKGKNSGKYFYGCCEYPKQCDFFIWEGEEPKGRDFKRTEVVDDVQCECGKSAVRKVSSTAKNKGRQFYTCNKAYKQCKFFKWVE